MKWRKQQEGTAISRAFIIMFCKQLIENTETKKNLNEA